MKPLVIGTRGSPLAVAQAGLIQERLRRLVSAPITLKIIVTSGDRIPGELKTEGGKSLFSKEIEEELLAGTVDLAVHSLKDLAAELPAGLVVAAVPLREDPGDLFLSERFPSLAALPAGARIGTSSARRMIQIRKLNPAVTVVPLRGNIDTRLKKMAGGEVEAVILAVAGLKRLQLTARYCEPLHGRLLPAIGQGALAIETRADNTALNEWLVQHLHDPASGAAVTAERQFMRRLGATCDTPIAGLGRVEGKALTLTGWVASRDGGREIQESRAGEVAHPEALGDRLADYFIAQGALKLIMSS